MQFTPCPICRKPVTIPEGDAPMGVFPFCSDRCKLVDLGRWLDGKYQIPVVEADESDSDSFANPLPPTEP